MPIVFVHLLAASAQQATSTLEVDVDGLRNSRGVIQACLTQDRASFPDCGADPRAIRQTIKVSSPRLVFRTPPGNYAITLFHDENANDRLDTLFGIPKEGFGFSRNPVVRFRAPRYDNVNIQLGPGLTRMRIRLQYLL
jgi:uncharacterized protein (DUF2141 family)